MHHDLSRLASKQSNKKVEFEPGGVRDRMVKGILQGMAKTPCRVERRASQTKDKQWCEEVDLCRVLPRSISSVQDRD